MLVVVASEPAAGVDAATGPDDSHHLALFADFKPDGVMHLAAESHVDRSIDEPGAFVTTNVVGTYVMLDAALAYWRGLPTGRREAFRFVHVSTDEVYGSLGETGLFTEETAYDPSSPYSASKAGVISLVQTACNELYGTGVRVNAVAPGLIETGMTKPIFDGARARGNEDKIGQLNPTTRYGEPEEIAAAALFLASDDASYVNGQTLAVDGGLSTSHPVVRRKK